MSILIEGFVHALAFASFLTTVGVLGYYVYLKLKGEL